MRRKLNMDTPVILLLSCVLAACVMLVLVMGAKAYAGMAERDTAALDGRTCRQYMTARIRRQDDASCVMRVLGPDGQPAGRGPALEFVETIEGEDYRTVIYCHEGRVLELFTLAGLSWSWGDGEAVLDASSLGFESTDGGMRVVMTGLDGEVYDFYVGLLSGKGGGHE